MTYRFFDPHPGFGGAMIPLPVPVKEVVDSLNGKVMELQECVSLIQAAWPQGSVKVVEKDKMIVFGIGEVVVTKSFKAPRHSWRAIRYEEA